MLQVVETKYCNLLTHLLFLIFLVFHSIKHPNCKTQMVRKLVSKRFFPLIQTCSAAVRLIILGDMFNFLLDGSLVVKEHVFLGGAAQLGMRNQGIYFLSMSKRLFFFNPCFYRQVQIVKCLIGA